MDRMAIPVQGKILANGPREDPLTPPQEWPPPSDVSGPSGSRGRDSSQRLRGIGGQGEEAMKKANGTPTEPGPAKGS
jgi:hypothetical protein